MATSTNSTLVSILNNYYGVGELAACPITVLWAADRAANEVGVDAAKKQLTKLNRKREKAGRMPAYFDYGHRMS